MAIRIGEIAPFWSSGAGVDSLGNKTMTPNYKSTFAWMSLVGAGVTALVLSQGPGFRSLDTKALRFIASAITLAIGPAAVFATAFLVTRRCRTQTTPFGAKAPATDEEAALLHAQDGAQDGAQSELSSQSGDGVGGESLADAQSGNISSPAPKVSAWDRCRSNCPPGPKLTGLLVAVLATGAVAAVVGPVVGFKDMWMTLVKSSFAHHLAVVGTVAAGGVAGGLISFAGHWAAENASCMKDETSGCLSKVANSLPCFSQTDYQAIA